jgi:hypothetical protein
MATPPIRAPWALTSTLHSSISGRIILGADHLDVVADRGYFNSPEILACEQADITVTLPKPMTSGAKSDGRRQAGFRLSAD